MTTWTPPLASQPLAATVEVPGSKSEANRALLLAALADAPSSVVGVPPSRDSDLMVGALTTLGAQIRQVGDGLVVTPPPELTAGSSIDCGLAGTVMRFVPPAAMLAGGQTHFFGDARASERPMRGLCQALRQIGASITSQAGGDTDQLPFCLAAPERWAREPIIVDASASSQFVSGLLLAGTRYPGGLDLTHVGGSLPSRPHIDMTIAMLASHGVIVTEPEPNHWLVPPGVIAAVDAVIEPDLTNAAAFLVAGIIAGGYVKVARWPARTTQPGDMIRDIIEAFGGRIITEADGGLSAQAGETMTSSDIDLSDASELTPVVAALAAVMPGVSRITGIGHIRGHETDRLVAIADGLGAVGVGVEIEPDGLRIDGGTRRHGGVIQSRGDHRLVHMAALIGLVTPGVTVEQVEAVSKTMPNFTNVWETAVASR